jgi:hypothetical protein
MKERHGCSDYQPSIPGCCSEERSLFYRAYRLPDPAIFSTWNALPARSYFRAALGLLLPSAVGESSWARARKASLANCKVRKPVGALERPPEGLTPLAFRSQYLLTQVIA